MGEEEIDPVKEIEAIQTVAKALADLDDAAVKRVLRWAADRFGASDVVEEPAEGGNDLGSGSSVEPSSFEDVADLFSAADPGSDAERALVVGYWLQYVNGVPEFDSQTANRELKHLGHGVSNITAALTNLKGRKPQLVIQTRKSGTTKQARKKYKLTNAGKHAVEEMIRRTEEV